MIFYPKKETVFIVPILAIDQKCALRKGFIKMIKENATVPIWVARTLVNPAFCILKKIAVFHHKKAVSNNIISKKFVQKNSI